MEGPSEMDCFHPAPLAAARWRNADGKKRMGDDGNDNVVCSSLGPQDYPPQTGPRSVQQFLHSKVA